MSDGERYAAALADPDAQPLTDADMDMDRMKQTPRVKIIRRALGVTQEGFSVGFRIPLGTLRDWDQGVAQPDQTARAYLRAIAGDAQAVLWALAAGPGNTKLLSFGSCPRALTLPTASRSGPSLSRFAAEGFGESRAKLGLLGGTISSNIGLAWVQSHTHLNERSEWMRGRFADDCVGGLCPPYEFGRCHIIVGWTE